MFDSALFVAFQTFDGVELYPSNCRSFATPIRAKYELFCGAGGRVYGGGEGVNTVLSTGVALLLLKNVTYIEYTRLTP